jgi:hypothetical protein
VTSPPQDGTLSKMQPTSFVRLRPSRTPRTPSESWLTLAEGRYYSLNPHPYTVYRVDIKLTQTNDIGMLLNSIGQIDISECTIIIKC